MRYQAGAGDRGFTLIEATILMVILSIVAVGAAVSLQALSRGPSANDLQLTINNVLIDKMEQLRALDFSAMTVGTALSDTVTVNGTTYVRRVTIALADANGGGNDADFKQVTVSVNSQSLVTWVTQP